MKKSEPFVIQFNLQINPKYTPPMKDEVPHLNDAVEVLKKFTLSNEIKNTQGK